MVSCTHLLDFSVVSQKKLQNYLEANNKLYICKRKIENKKDERLHRDNPSDIDEEWIKRDGKIIIQKLKPKYMV